MDNDPDFVTVSVRVKPSTASSQQCTGKKSLEVISKTPPVLLMVDRAQTFHFDNIFTDNSSQDDIYNGTVKHLIDYVKKGYTCTVFAYGQTGTGKSFTIGTDPQATEENLGLIPRSLNSFLEYNPDDDSEVTISLSYIEIYNTKVFDLLSNDKVPLAVKGFKAEGFRQEKVFSLHDAKHFLEMGNKNRHTAGTKQNAKSSRSHAIFTIYCAVKHGDNETTGKLNLVDLAGCESAKKTGNQGSTFHEGVNINRGLLAIGQVMTALASNSGRHIPYRSSLVTTILQDSLNTKNFISLITCVSCQPEDTTETMHALEFAQGVKKIKNKPEVNDAILQYKKENPTLFELPRSSMTPFKKPATPLKTPMKFKKHKPLKSLSLINEGSDNNMSSESSADSKSLGLSAVSSIINGELSAQQSLSPVIKKYMGALESSLMNKLESIILNTLKRPSRASLAKNGHAKENIESTPSMGNLQQQVSQLVRMELAQLTRGSEARATSSPLDSSLSNVCKVLTYDSPAEMKEAAEILQTTKTNEGNDKDVFRMPQLHVVKTVNRTLYKGTPPLSPIHTPVVATRRSVRLSMKRMNYKSFDTTNAFIDSSNIYFGNQTKRGDNTLVQHKEDIAEKTNNTTNRTSMRLATKRKKAEHVEQANIKKSKKANVMATPARLRVLKNSNKDSPYTSHAKEVLEILNEGTASALKKLPTIGESSAMQIIAFRRLKGPITSISDLARMPGWNKGKCDRFAEYYFLKKSE